MGVRDPSRSDLGTVTRLGETAWPALGGRPLLLVPLGSCEQHGPHLPLDTDTRIAVAIAERAAAGRDDVLVAPALAFGASWEHAGFPGLLSLNASLVTLVIVELARSADWAAGIILVNGHGGNASAVAKAVETVRYEGRSVRSWSPGYAAGHDDGAGAVVRAPAADRSSDLHAGRSETSMMLAIEPSLVHLNRAEAGWTGLMESLGHQPVIALSANGVLGDPAGATAEYGEALLDQLAADLGATIDEVLATTRRP